MAPTKSDTGDAKHEGAHIGAEHEELAVSEIDDRQEAENQRDAEGHQHEDRAEGEAGEELQEEEVEGH